MAGRAGIRKWKFWRRFSHRVQVALVAVALLLVVARLAMPFVLRHYVDRQLDQIENYEGNVGAIQINLFRGAYRILDLRLTKTNANVPVEFVTIPEMDLSLEWKQLFNGAVVGEVVLEGPRVNFINGPDEQSRQTGVGRGWSGALESLFPVTINRFEVNDGVIRYADPHREVPVDMYVTNLFATATNLTNVRNEGSRLPAGLVARGLTTGGGRLELELHMNPLAETPTFKLYGSVTNMDLTALNDFMRSYGNFDVQSGRFSLFMEVAAADGRFQGISKPFFLDFEVITWKEATRQSIVRSFWEAIVAGLGQLFQNQPRDQLATTIPIEGSFESGTDLDLWTTIGGILRNAFVQALLPRLRPPRVPLPDEEGSPPGGGSSRSQVRDVDAGSGQEEAGGAELMM